jgi:hypothetical protein
MMKHALGVVALAVAVAGCAEMKELDDWAMKKAHEGRAPAAGTQANRGGSAVTSGGAQCAFNPGYQKSDNCCILEPYMSSLDVDTAFTQASQEYRFPTKVKGTGKDPTRLYRYMTFPGQSHIVANDVVPRSGGVLSQGFWLALRVETGPQKGMSRIDPTYCATPGVRATDLEAWHKAVQDSIYATMPPVQGRP